MADEELKLRAEKYDYENYPDSQPYYVIRPFLSNIMALARSELSHQAQSGTLTLKTIRLMSCLPEQVLAEYDDLRALIRENQIRLDIAPKNEVLSLLEGMTVTTPNEDWLRASLVN
jgi:hypothetical protein